MTSPRPRLSPHVDFACVWGDTLAEFERVQPDNTFLLRWG